MNWERMSIDELAAFRRNGGEHVVKVNGTWWVEVRPFFFRPVFPFSEITPALANYPLSSAVGGVLHLVPEGRGNSWMNLFLYGDLQHYTLDGMGKAKWTIKKGMGNFRAARITDLGSFTEQAYPVYRSFYERTRYFYKSERTEKRAFISWAGSVFSNPKVIVMGAYQKERLCAVEIFYQVEDVIIDDVFFSDTASQQLQVTDFMVHTLRDAARSSDAKWLFRGFPSGKESLDRAKTSRGCKVVKLPAHCRINPLALCIGKVAMNASYRKLAAMTSPPEPSAGTPSQ